MKYKDWLFHIISAIFVVLLIQWWVGYSHDESAQHTTAHAGQKFKAPSRQESEACKPLNLEIDFVDAISKGHSQLTNIATQHANYVFSTEGASLQTLEFKRNWAGKEGYLTTVFPPAYIDREKRCFLVALQEKTPYFFTLEDVKELDNYHLITYQAEIDGGVLRKEFTVYKHQYQIDLEISLSGTQQTQWQPRVFFSSPLIPELGNKDATIVLIGNDKGKITTEVKNPALLDSYWMRPTIFGTQDRYFLHTLVGDQQNFVQRAYFKTVDLDSLYTVLEGPVDSMGPWKLSFYFGPKEYAAVTAVDPRLEQALNYGWLAFVSRPVSHVLLQILNIIYDYCKNYGLAIIILVLLMRIILTPLAFSAESSRKKQADIQKKLQHVAQKYKHDKEELLKAKAAIVRAEGMPSLKNLLMLFLQIPLFIALSWVLSNSIQLYMAPFLWIPDLSSPDPYYILSILLAIAISCQALITDSSKRMSLIVVALFFGAFTASLSSGLVLYILVSTAAAAAQTGIINYFKRA